MNEGWNDGMLGKDQNTEYSRQNDSNSSSLLHSNPDGFVKGRISPFSVIPAKVPRQARDPEFIERAGTQFL